MSALALWNLHDAIMAGEQPNDCPDCGADEWSPSAEAYETTGRLVCEHCADAAMEDHEMTTPCVTVPVEILRELIDSSSEVRDLLNATPAMQRSNYDGVGARFVNAIGAAQRAYVSLSAAPAPEGQAVDGPEDDELPGDFLARVGMDGALWADGFRKMALKLGYSDMDEGWLIGWFCNAVMAGYDHAQRRFDPAIATREEAPAEAGEVECDGCDGDRCVYVGSLCNPSAQPPAREDAQPVAYRMRCQSDQPHKGGWWSLVGKHDGDHAIATGGGKNLQPLYTHPAPDALRVAVEALETINHIRSEMVGVSVDSEAANAWALALDAAADHARQALAALQAEQKGGA